MTQTSTDPGRKSSAWPFIAIALLAVLLTAFLAVHLSRRDDRPVVVKELPPLPVTVEPPASAEATAGKPKPPEKDPPPEPKPDPRQEAFEKKVQEARKALEEKRWPEALSAVKAARELKDDAAALQPIEEGVAKGMAAEEAERQARLKRERDWTALVDRVDKGLDAQLWDAVAADIEKFAVDHPSARQDEPFRRLEAKAHEKRTQSDQAYVKSMKLGQEHFDKGHYPQAIAAARRAGLLYPERKPDVERFQAKANEMIQQRNMVRIPDTPCWIGNDHAEDEKPRRQVKLPAFFIDKYETTNEEYYAFTAATEHRAPPYWSDNKPPPGTERHPVLLVNADDAARYAAWAAKRLPTEEEWEAAARGPEGRVYPWGDAFQEKEDAFRCNSLEFFQTNRKAVYGTTPVDQFDGSNSGSPFGVYGMGGNVWEWTATVIKKNGEEFRILKGGSFLTPARAIRCANRMLENPSLLHRDVGFRCARDGR